MGDHHLELPGLVELHRARHPPVHLFTVDVEEYFHAHALERHLPPGGGDALPTRVGPAMEYLLDRLAAHGHRGTFFVLGWVARRHAALVRRIVDEGHGLASHGESHARVGDGGPRRFCEEVRASRRILEQVGGVAVRGYRAPSFSIVPGREWALDILLEEGYRYDSSLYPIRRSGYGHAGAASGPHRIPRLGGEILEVPPTTLAVGRMRLPAAGGAYFRLLPYALTAVALRAAERSGRPGVVYLHPWEVDPEQPRLAVPATTRIRHYGGLRSMRDRLERLLTEFRFTSIEALFPEAAPRLPAGVASA